MKCLATDLEEVLDGAAFSREQPQTNPHTNLLEILFGEGRRRSNVIPRFMNERSD